MKRLCAALLLCAGVALAEDYYVARALRDDVRAMSSEQREAFRDSLFRLTNYTTGTVEFSAAYYDTDTNAWLVLCVPLCNTTGSVEQVDSVAAAARAFVPSVEFEMTSDPAAVIVDWGLRVEDIR